MIQRVQSIYLFLATMLTVAFIFSGLFLVTGPDTELFVSVMGFIDQESVVESPYTIVFLFLAVLEIGLLSVAFLNYKTQKKQIKFIKMAIWVDVMLLLGLAGLYYLLSADIGNRVIPMAGALHPLFILVFDYLALKGVKKDLALLRSVDRLR